MKPTINTLRGVFSFIIVAAAFLISCNKEPDLIGLDLLPPGDRLKIGYMDTTTLVAYSIYEDTVRTDEMSQGIIGSIFDPVFGKTSATLYTQLKMTTNAPTFGTNPVCDSIVLVLPYISVFGDTTAMQTFKIYELTEELHLDSLYYSNMHAEYNQASLLATKTFLPRVNDSIIVDTATKIIPQLRIQFNTSLGTRILAATAADLLTNNAFVQFFKGIAITTDEENTSGNGSLVSFNLLSSYSKLKLYYHNTIDTTVYDFAINASCARFNQYNHFGHNVAAVDFKAQLNGDTTLGQQKLYIQALGGTKIKLRFPDLRKWAGDRKIAINDAQLIMTNADVSASYAPPSKLGMRIIFKDGTVDFTIDEKEGASYFDGNYNKSAKSYRFRISRYIQQLLIPATDNSGLYLFVPGASISANRLVLYGTNPTALPLSERSKKRMKLEIRYTIVK